jgi:AcrR family transcriptional regulator
MLAQYSNATRTAESIASAVTRAARSSTPRSLSASATVSASMEQGSSPGQAPRRADAKRNRDRILTAARAAFADPDADVSMAEIARRAGVGSATLYRNFASRRELLEALYTSEIDAVCEAAATTGGDTPGATFTAWLRRFYAYITSKRTVAAELLQHASADDPVFGAGLAAPSRPGRFLVLLAVLSLTAHAADLGLILAAVREERDALAITAGQT